MHGASGALRDGTQQGGVVARRAEFARVGHTDGGLHGAAPALAGRILERHIHQIGARRRRRKPALVAPRSDLAQRKAGQRSIRSDDARIRSREVEQRSACVGRLELNDALLAFDARPEREVAWRGRAHEPAHRALPELLVPVPRNPLSAPAARGVASECDAATETVVPVREDRVHAVGRHVDDRDLRQPIARHRHHVPAERRQRARASCDGAAHVATVLRREVAFDEQAPGADRNLADEDLGELARARGAVDRMERTAADARDLLEQRVIGAVTHADRADRDALRTRRVGDRGALLRSAHSLAISQHHHVTRRCP